MLILGFAIALTVQYMRLRSQESMLDNLESERLRLTEEIDELTKTTEYMQTDEYIEQAAREQLGMLLPDEIR